MSRRRQHRVLRTAPGLGAEHRRRASLPPGRGSVRPGAGGGELHQRQRLAAPDGRPRRHRTASAGARTHRPGTGADRQEAAHAHQVVFANDLMFVVDLGSDRIWRYILDVDALTVEQLRRWCCRPVSARDSSWSRPIMPTSSGELSNQLAVFAGTELVAVVPAYGAALPAGNLAATLLSPKPGQLLVSHRGADRICLFTADGDSVELETEFSSGGAGPRHVAVVDGGCSWPISCPTWWPAEPRTAVRCSPPASRTRPASCRSAES